MIDTSLELFTRILDEWEPAFVIAAGSLLVAGLAIRAVVALAARDKPR